MRLAQPEQRRAPLVHELEQQRVVVPVRGDDVPAPAVCEEQPVGPPAIRQPAQGQAPASVAGAASAGLALAAGSPSTPASLRC